MLEFVQIVYATLNFDPVKHAIASGNSRGSRNNMCSIPYIPNGEIDIVTTEKPPGSSRCPRELPNGIAILCD
jgi:hypothetical protein